MEKIYNLTGKLLRAFQELENNLSYIVYRKDKEIGKKDATYIFNKSMGIKIKYIEKEKSFDKNDIVIFDYLRERRNYLVHEFFIDLREENLIEKEKELSDMIENVNLINSALLGMAVEYYKNEKKI